MSRTFTFEQGGITQTEFTFSTETTKHWQNVRNKNLSVLDIRQDLYSLRDDQQGKAHDYHLRLLAQL